MLMTNPKTQKRTLRVALARTRHQVEGLSRLTQRRTKRQELVVVKNQTLTVERRMTSNHLKRIQKTMIRALSLNLMTIKVKKKIKHHLSLIPSQMIHKIVLKRQIVLRRRSITKALSLRNMIIQVH